MHRLRFRAARGGSLARPLAALLTTMALAPPAPAQQVTPSTAPPAVRSGTSAPAQLPIEPTRPRVALVLSGGGARGFAHVGVLQVLEELRVPVDIVVGASMGAVVGGAYAAGRSTAELDAFVRATDWSAIVADRTQRDRLSLRRKEDDVELPSRIELGLPRRDERQGLLLPPAAVNNAAVEEALARLLPASARSLATAQQPIPFNAVATDLLTGELVDLADIPLLPALRATMSVPGVFAPIRLGAQLVVDGGLVRNLPVDLARQMGAQVVIAVNVGTPLAPESELGSAFGVAQQMLNILTEQNVQRSLKELQPNDIRIEPDLRSVSFLDFAAHGRAIAAGRAAAQAMAEQLRVLSVPAEPYAAWQQQRRLAPGTTADVPRPLVSVTVRSTTPAPQADAQTLAALSGLVPGTRITQADAHEAADRIRARGEFERVDVQVDEGTAGRAVTITTTEAPWAMNRLRLGLMLATDFRDDHRVTLSALHVQPWLNATGGELRTTAHAGSRSALSSEWWQPLTRGPFAAQPFISAGIGYESENQDLYVAGVRSARISVRAKTASVGAGLVLGRHSELRLGVTRRLGEGRVILPASTDAFSPFAETNAFAQLRHDTLESVAFPVRGQLIALRWEGTRPTTRERPSLARSAVQALLAFRLDRWGTLDLLPGWGGHVYAEWSRSPSSFAPLSLGGFLRLSGAPRDSINGGKVLFGRAVLARHIGQMPAGFGGAVRAGLSFELGEGFEHDDEVRIGRLRPAGSAFVSVDTRFGPAYVALGAARSAKVGPRAVGGPTVYLFLGPVW